MTLCFSMARASMAVCVWALATCAGALLEGKRCRNTLHVMSLLQRPRFEQLAAVRDWGLTTHTIDAAHPQRQRLPNDCGPMALQRLLSLHDTATPDHASWRPQLGADGCSLEDLRLAAQRAGLPTSVVWHRRVVDLEPPVLLHLQRRHFVVLEARQQNRVRLFDPAHGVLRVDRRRLQRDSSGWGLVATNRTRIPGSSTTEVR